MAHELGKLPYAYDALEPHMDANTVEIHYSKHHQGYVDKLNAALEKHPELGLADKKVEELLKDINGVPADIRTAVKNNGGGHLNHTLFWKCMKKDGGGEPSGEVADAINKAFGSYNDFKEKFGSAAKTHFASGWAWLSVNMGNLEIESTPNHDTPVSQGKKPILVIDVWEHSYYLLYKWQRAGYVDAFFNLINWDQVNDNYKKALE